MKTESEYRCSKGQKPHMWADNFSGKFVLNDEDPKKIQLSLWEQFKIYIALKFCSLKRQHKRK